MTASPTATKSPKMPGPAAASAAHRTVLITGVSRGLGKALALELAKRGHTVIGCSRSQDKLNALQAELTSASQSSTSSSSSSAAANKHLVMNVDVRSDSSVKELACSVVEKKAVPDIIVNNAGTINRNNKIWEVPAEEFDTVIDTNLKGIANILRHFIPLMIASKQGVIVNMSSGWGRSAAAQVAPYCASKWGVEGLTRSVAKELPPGMSIVALSPGVINTEMLQSCFGESASLYQTPESCAEEVLKRYTIFPDTGSSFHLTILSKKELLIVTIRAPKAANMILNLTMADNGASLTV